MYPLIGAQLKTHEELSVNLDLSLGEAFSSLALYTKNYSYVASLNSQLSPQHKKTVGLCLGSHFFSAARKFSSGSNLKQSQG